MSSSRITDPRYLYYFRGAIWFTVDSKGNKWREEKVRRCLCCFTTSTAWTSITIWKMVLLKIHNKLLGLGYTGGQEGVCAPVTTVCHHRAMVRTVITEWWHNNGVIGKSNDMLVIWTCNTTLLMFHVMWPHTKHKKKTSVHTVHTSWSSSDSDRGKGAFNMYYFVFDSTLFYHESYMPQPKIIAMTSLECTLIKPVEFLSTFFWHLNEYNKHSQLALASFQVCCSLLR